MCRCGLHEQDALGHVFANVVPFYAYCRAHLSPDACFFVESDELIIIYFSMISHVLTANAAKFIR